MSSILMRKKPHNRALPGKLFLALGGAGVTWAAFSLFKAGTLVRGLVSGKVSDKAVPEIGYPEPFAMQVDAATEIAESPQDEWMETLEKAMEKMPLKAGFDESVWTAPMLSEHIRKVHGISIPVTRIRSALKGLGYHWKHTHYALARTSRRQAA